MLDHFQKDFSKSGFQKTIKRDLVVTSIENQQIIHLFNIIKILNNFKIFKNHRIGKFINNMDFRKLDFLSAYCYHLFKL